jgi:hypothetical protein
MQWVCRDAINRVSTAQNTKAAFLKMDAAFFVDQKKKLNFMRMKLIQKQGSRRREFELIGNKLHVKTKSMGERNEYMIDIEYLGEEKYFKTYSRVGPRIVGSIFYVIMVISFIGFFQEGNLTASENLGALLLGVVLFGGLGTLAFLSPLRNELHLVGGSAQVMFLLNSPSKEEMDNFINEIITRSRKILIEKYSKIDADLPEEIQINNFYWLKQRGLISEEDYEDLKQEYRNQRLMR